MVQKQNQMIYRHKKDAYDFVLSINQSVDQAMKLMKLMEQLKPIPLSIEMHHCIKSNKKYLEFLSIFTYNFKSRPRKRKADNTFDLTVPSDDMSIIYIYNILTTTTIINICHVITR